MRAPLPARASPYFAVVAGVFVTAFYSFRMYFLVFHGKERFHHKPFPGEHDHHDDHAEHHAAARVALGRHRAADPAGVPSVFIGYLTIGPMLHGDFFKDSIVVDAARHPAMAEIGKAFHGALAMATHSLMTLPFWLAAGGVVTAWFFYLKQPSIPAAISALRVGLQLLDNKYYMDWFNEHVLSRRRAPARHGPVEGRRRRR